jgi:hypothetical protein
VCILPDLPACRDGIEAAVHKVDVAGGTCFRFEIPALDPGTTDELTAAFRQLSAKEYEEIIEECRTKFVREIEYERGRGNYVYEEAEEIREDFEKIERWFERVVARDWFHTGRREEVAGELAGCERLLEAFEEDVYRRAGTDPAVHPPRRPER